MRLGPKLEDCADQLQVVITAFAFVLLFSATSPSFDNVIHIIRVLQVLISWHELWSTIIIEGPR